MPPTLKVTHMQDDLWVHRPVQASRVLGQVPRAQAAVGLTELAEDGTHPARLKCPTVTWRFVICYVLRAMSWWLGQGV